MRVRGTVVASRLEPRSISSIFGHVFLMVSVTRKIRLY